MTNEQPLENQTFLIRFYNHLKQYYMMFGIIGLVVAGSIGVSLLIGFIVFNIIIPVAQLIPPWGYAIIGVVSLPAILALVHTFVETNNATNKNDNCVNNKKYPSFRIKIENTVYDWSYVYLYADKGWGISETIAFESCVNNAKVKSVANDLLKNAKSIYDKHIEKLNGTFTEPLPIDNEKENIDSLKEEIKDLKQKFDELSKNKTNPTLEPLTNLEKQNRENNLK